MRKNVSNEIFIFELAKEKCENFCKIKKPSFKEKRQRQ